jgi:hypothetical protein
MNVRAMQQQFCAYLLDDPDDIALLAEQGGYAACRCDDTTPWSATSGCNLIFSSMAHLAPGSEGPRALAKAATEQFGKTRCIDNTHR